MRFEATLADIAREFQSKGFTLGPGIEGNTQIKRISAVETSEPGDLVFMDKKDYIETVRTRRPSVVVTSAALQAAIAEIPGVVVVAVPNVALAHALVKKRFGDRDFATTGWSGVHPSAVVHPTAELASDVIVEPNAVIGARTKIGRGTRVMAGVIIENDVVIGENTVLHPAAVIGYKCRVGNECVIGPRTVVGSDGFGWAQDEKRKAHPIPQTGIVVLEDRVRLGAGCCVDRATYHETRIGAGTKTDNLCHFAHNVQVGQDCLLTAMFCCAGSTKIGDRMMSSGQTGVLDHLEISSDVILLHRAGVNKDIEKPGVYAGLPLQPLNEYMRNSAASKSGADTRKRLIDLEERLAKLEAGTK